MLCSKEHRNTQSDAYVRSVKLATTQPDIYVHRRTHFHPDTHVQEPMQDLRSLYRTSDTRDNSDV